MPPCDMLLPIGDGGRVWQAITRRQALVDGAPDLSISIPKSGSLTGLVENSTARGVFFTQLEFSAELAVNKTQAEQYPDSGLLPDAWPETLSHNHVAAQSHP